MNIKVCGITQLKQLQQLDGLSIEFAGLIFYEKSPRFVDDKIAKEDLKNADFDLRKVGVFVNPEMIDVLDAIDDYGLDVVQLHGNETPEMCDDLSSEVEVIKAFSLDDSTKSIDEMIEPYDAFCDYYLFDAASKNGAVGGTGTQFNWKLLEKSRIEKPFFFERRN